MTQSSTKILVTGAAGFVGSHTVDLLVQRGHRVLALDVLDPQVHGPSATPRHLSRHIESGALEFLQGDVRDFELMQRVLGEVGSVIHLAAAVGVGQSMYMPRHYMDVNVGGTSVIAEVLANRSHHIKRIIVASSMSLYGEGGYLCGNCGPVHPSERDEARMKDGDWEHRCPACGGGVEPRQTTEAKPLCCTSAYAISKRVQEDLLVLFGRAYHVPVVALRYFNIYGPRQSLNNPYTGAAAIFLSRLMNGKAPVVFEDGLQSRDFIHVRDVARANVAALESSVEGQCIYNVGTGRATSIVEIARVLSRRLGLSIEPEIAHRFRAGDIRHCFSDPSRIAQALGFRAEISLDEGMQDLITWSRSEKPSDQFEACLSELESRKLVQ